MSAHKLLNLMVCYILVAAASVHHPKNEGMMYLLNRNAEEGDITTDPAFLPTDSAPELPVKDSVKELQGISQDHLKIHRTEEVAKVGKAVASTTKDKKADHMATADEAEIEEQPEIDQHHGVHADLEAEVPPLVDSHELEGHAGLDHVHDFASKVVVPVAGIMLLCIIMGHFFSQFPLAGKIPESAWTVFFSVVLGLCANHFLLTAEIVKEESFVLVNAGFLNLILLPIIIFETGWSLKQENFVSQLEYIGIFAVFGTLFVFGFIAIVSHWMASQGWHVVDGWRENLCFGALISAVDPVATLSTLSKLGLEQSRPLLHTMIVGESIVNDAVAIVLFKTINNSWLDLTFFNCTIEIMKTLFGSCMVGILISGVLIMLMRFTHLREHGLGAAMYVGICAWFIFAVAESVHVSGIIANLVAGCMFRKYGSKHVADEEIVDNFLTVAGHLADTGVFILCGVCTAMMSSDRGLRFAVCACILCLISRALSTAGCGQVCNFIKRRKQEPESHYISYRHQVMMWHAGLRGGIALVLALEIDGSWCKHKATIINATFGVICFSLLVLGSSTEYMLYLCNFLTEGKRRSVVVERNLFSESKGALGHGFKQSVGDQVLAVLDWLLVGPENEGNTPRNRKPLETP